MSPDRHERILDATLHLLGEGGIAAVSMRAVAETAGVSLGLVNYHYNDKASLISAALQRIGELDLALVQPDATRKPEAALRAALHRIAEPEFLTTEYLALRLQLWSLARTNPDFQHINNEAQSAYRDGLAALIEAARPDLGRAECRRRAADINLVQNGIWLSALLGLDRPSMNRGISRCEDIAFAE